MLLTESLRPHRPSAGARAAAAQRAMPADRPSVRPCKRTVDLSSPTLAHDRPERCHQVHSRSTLDRGEIRGLVSELESALASPYRATEQMGRTDDHVAVRHRELDRRTSRPRWRTGEERPLALEQTGEPVELCYIRHDMDIGLVRTRVNGLRSSVQVHSDRAMATLV